MVEIQDGCVVGFENSRQPFVRFFEFLRLKVLTLLFLRSYPVSIRLPVHN